MSDQPDVLVESPKYLPDKITGEPREHDIVLTYRAPHRQLVIAIECRDRSRNVSIGQVEEFRSKCVDTGVNKGITVASRGFIITALAKAAHYSIDCLTLAQVDHVNWCVQTEMVVCNREMKHCHAEIGLPRSVEGKAWKLYFRGAEGNDEWIDILGGPDNLLNSVWPHVPDPSDELAGEAQIEIQNLEDFYLGDEEGGEHLVKALCLPIRWEAVETTVPLTYYRYGADINEPIFETIVTNAHNFGYFEGEQIAGRIMLIRDDEMRLRLAFMHERSSTTVVK